MIRWFKHLFGHEWLEDPNSYGPYHNRVMRIQDHICAYPGCSWTSVYDSRDRLRFGERKDV